VKYPLDKVCVKSGIFCPSCQRKIESGLVEKHEIEIIKALMDLEENGVKELRKGEYSKSDIVNDFVVIILRGEWGLSEIDKLTRKVSEKLGKRTKVLIDTKDTRRFVEQALAPARVIGLNLVWLPDGSEQIVIRVHRRDKRFLGNTSEWVRFLSKYLSKPVRIEFT